MSPRIIMIRFHAIGYITNIFNTVQCLNTFMYNSTQYIALKPESFGHTKMQTMTKMFEERFTKVKYIFKPVYMYGIGYIV